MHCPAKIDFFPRFSSLWITTLNGFKIARLWRKFARWWRKIATSGHTEDCEGKPLLPKPIDLVPCVCASLLLGNMTGRSGSSFFWRGAPATDPLHPESGHAIHACVVAIAMCCCRYYYMRDCLLPPRTIEESVRKKIESRHPGG